MKVEGFVPLRCQFFGQSELVALALSRAGLPQNHAVKYRTSLATVTATAIIEYGLSLLLLRVHNKDEDYLIKL